jgi:hypothetical protein
VIIELWVGWLILQANNAKWLSFRAEPAHHFDVLTRGGGAKERVTTFKFDFPTFRLITGSKSLSSSPRCCDHCRATLGSRVHDYWRMHFCSKNCVAAYQARLSAATREKILQLDGNRNSLKIAS